MSARARRRRAALLLALALACGGLAAAEVSGRVSEIESRVGAPVDVLVAARDLERGEALRPADVEVREWPRRYAPADGLAAAGEIIGVRLGGPVARGTPITVGLFGAGGGGEGGHSTPLRAGERALELPVSGGEALGGQAAPGTRVDVVVSTEPRTGPGRAFLALEDVELLGLRAGAAQLAEAGSGGAGGVATLRVTARQAVYLTAARNYARELRILIRPAGDARRVGPTAVGAGEL